MFERVKVEDEEHDAGYDDWFRSKDDDIEHERVSFYQFEKEFYKTSWWRENILLWWLYGWNNLENAFFGNTVARRQVTFRQWSKNQKMGK